MNWRQFSACSNTQTELFFPDNQHTEKAQRICGECPVRQDCFDFATRTRIPHGVFGGEDGLARRERLQIDKAGRPLSLYPDSRGEE